jgi:hypothetical protein
MELFKVLIIYFIFMVYQKGLAIFMQHKFPTVEDKKNAPPFWKSVYKLRVVNAIISFLFIMYIFANFKLNHYTTVVLYMLLLGLLNFLLFTNENIYYIMKKTSDNDKFVSFMGTDFNLYWTYITILYVFYALLKIFFST